MADPVLIRAADGTGAEFPQDNTVAIDGSGGNHLVGIVGSAYDTTAVGAPSATYNGVSCTLIGSSLVGPSERSRVWAFELSAPASGVHDFHVTWSGGQDGNRVATAVGIFNNVNQSTPRRGTFVVDVGTGGTPTIDCPSAAGDLVVVGLMVGANAALTATGTVTKRAEEITPGQQGCVGMGDAPGGTSVTMGWTVTPSEDWAIIAFSLQSDGGAATTTTPDRFQSRIPMRAGPLGLTRGKPFQFDTTPTPIGAASLASWSLSGFATLSVNGPVVPPYQMSIPMRATAGGFGGGNPFRFHTAPSTTAGPASLASSVSLPLGATATAQVLVQAASTVALGLSATATATVLVTAASSVALPLSGSADATVLVQAVSDRTLQLSGTSVTQTVAITGPAYRMSIPMRPTAGGFTLGKPFRLSDDHPVTGSPIATSSISLSLGGTAAATVLIQGSAASSLTLGASATGAVLVQAASAAALSISGSATVQAGIQAASAVSLPLTPSGTAAVLVQAASVRTLPLVGTATAIGADLATALSLCAWPLSGSATGLVTAAAAGTPSVLIATVRARRALIVDGPPRPGT